MTDKGLTSELELVFNEFGDPLDANDPYNFRAPMRGLGGLKLGDENSYTLVMAPAHITQTHNVQKSSDDCFVQIFTLESRKMKQVLIDATATLPVSGDSIQVASFFKVETYNRKESHSMVLAETHYDKLWEVEINPRDLKRRLMDSEATKGDLDIKDEAKGRAFLSKYGHYFVSKELYGGAVTRCYTESQGTSVSQTSVQASGAERFSAVWQAFGFGAKAEYEKDVKKTQMNELKKCETFVDGGDIAQIKDGDVTEWRAEIQKHRKLARLSYFVSPTMDIFARGSPEYVILSDIYQKDQEEKLRVNHNWMVEEILTRVQARGPPVNVLVIGAKGAGKSSLINLIYNSLNFSNKYIVKCEPAANLEQTITKSLNRVDVAPKLRLFDFFGLDPSKDPAWTEDALKHIGHALTGNVATGQMLDFLQDHKFKPLFHRVEKCKQIVDHYIHGVIYVIDIFENFDAQVKLLDLVLAQFAAVHNTKLHTPAEERPHVHVFINKMDKLPGVKFVTAAQSETVFPREANPTDDAKMASLAKVLDKWGGFTSMKRTVCGFCPSVTNNISNFANSINRILALRLIDDVLSQACDSPKK